MRRQLIIGTAVLAAATAALLLIVRINVQKASNSSTKVDQLRELGLVLNDSNALSHQFWSDIAVLRNATSNDQQQSRDQILQIHRQRVALAAELATRASELHEPDIAAPAKLTPRLTQCSRGSARCWSMDPTSPHLSQQLHAPKV